MNIDKIDLAIVKELQKNCRQPLNLLSKRIKVSRWTIASRMKELEKEGVIRSYTLLLDYVRLGYDYKVTFWVKTDPKLLDIALDTVKDFEEIHWVSLILGDFDVHLIGLFKDRLELDIFIREKLGKVTGVLSIQTDIVLVHYFLKTPLELNPSPKKINISELDHRIIDIMSNNSRSNYDEISRQTMVDPQKVRYRVKRLEKLGVIKAYVANIDTWKMGNKYLTYFCLQIDPPNFDLALKQLFTFKEVLWINEASIITNLRITAIFRNRSSLHTFVRKKLDNLPGIQQVKIYHVIKVIAKHFI